MSNVIQSEIQWICVCKNIKNGRYSIANWSLAYLKKDSISAFCKDSGHDWKYWAKEYRWECVRVKVTMTI